jgi:hypothetical protein
MFRMLPEILGLDVVSNPHLFGGEVKVVFMATGDRGGCGCLPARHRILHHAPAAGLISYYWHSL